MTLTPLRGFPPGKLRVAEGVNKVTASYAPRMFSTAFTRAHHGPRRETHGSMLLIVVYFDVSAEQ